MHAETDRFSTTTVPQHSNRPQPPDPHSNLHAAEPPISSEEASSLACALSGLIVGVTSGAAIALLAARGELDERTVFGAAIGLILGLMAGRKVAAFPTVLGGAVFSMFVPLALMIGHAVRSGRVGDIGRDIGDPRFHLFAAIVFGGAALIGAALVALRKLIETISR